MDRTGKAHDRIKILAVCLRGAEGLGDALETALQPSESVQLTRENLGAEDLAASQWLLQRHAGKNRPSVVVLCLPPGNTLDTQAIFASVQRIHRGIPIFIVLETAEPHELRRLVDMGAADFSLLPLRVADLLPRLMRWSLSAAETQTVAWQLNENIGLQQFLGRSSAFVAAVNKIPKLARCDASVFITGETGTGKEMCARAIHHLGPRGNHPFVPVNCGAIPSELVENELFGHEAGAFTGATTAARGLVSDAEGGTLFLDEIDSLPLHTQVKFLRFLQDQEYRPLGARKPLQADVRVIAASNSEMDEVVRSGKFRADLYYRMNILPLKLPALRERREDIPLLARHFATKYAAEFCTPSRELSRAALEKLRAYEWPGNVRELENIIKRTMIFSEQPVVASDEICLPACSASPEELSFKALKARTIAEFETSYVRRMLVASNGNISQAARAAKKNRRAFWQLMRKHAVAVPTVSAGR